MAEDKNYTNTPLQEDELEIDLMEYARKLWAARKLLLKVAGVAFVLALVIHAFSGRLISEPFSQYHLSRLA